MRLRTYTNEYKQLRKAGVGKVVFPREEHISRLPTVKWSALKLYIQVTLYRLRRLFLEYMNIDRCMHACHYKELKKRPQFQGEQGMLGEKCGRGQRKGRKGSSTVNRLRSQKYTKLKLKTIAVTSLVMLCWKIL